MAASMEVESVFARKQLAKHGWTKGKGLGKSEDGIQNPIKVAFKNDKVGIGVNTSEEFTFHWWDHVFNKVAKKIKVTSDGEDTTVGSDNTDTIISIKKPTKHMKTKKNHVYGRFVSGGMLRNEPNNDEISRKNQLEEKLIEEEIKNLSKTDTIDKVFKETGFTAHKAARHGHRLSGKLKRLQEQEESILQVKTVINVVTTDTVEISKKKKKKRRRQEDSNSKQGAISNEEDSSIACHSKKTKRSKKEKVL